MKPIVIDFSTLLTLIGIIVGIIGLMNGRKIGVEKIQIPQWLVSMAIISICLLFLLRPGNEGLLSIIIFAGIIQMFFGKKR